MRLVSLFILPLLAAAPAAGESVPGSSDAAVPRLVVDRPEIDAGSVPQGETVEGVFVVRNAGEAELAILSAKPG